MVIVIILSVIVIFFTVTGYRQKKQAAEERIKQNKIRAAEEEFLNLEKNVLCEDGITRVYRNRMYGLIKEEVINIEGRHERRYAIYKNPNSWSKDLFSDAQYYRQLMRFNQVLEFKNGFCEVKGKILHELTRHFNIHSISITIDKSLSDHIIGVHFSKSNWFSEEGKILSQTEIIDGADFYRQKFNDQRRKSGVRTNRALARPIIFHEINNHFFIESWPWGKLRLFNGLINSVKYINGEPIGDVHSDSSQSIKKGLGTK